jgi:hypothetical protein
MNEDGNDLDEDVITLMYWHWRLQAIGHHVKQVQRPTYLHRKSLQVFTPRKWSAYTWMDEHADGKMRYWKLENDAGCDSNTPYLTHSTSMCWGTASDR